MKIFTRPKNIFSFLCVILLSGCAAPVAHIGNSGETIVCLGNSITAGVGAQPGEDYPSVLARKIDYPVINAGRGGDTTAQALERLEKDVLSKDPFLVIVELGGNDFLRKIPKEKTFSNLETIVRKIHESGAMVVVVSMRLGFFSDEYSREYKQIARKYGALFIPRVMRGILNNVELKSDGIHPNAKGYALIAQRIYRHLQPLLERHRRALKD